VSRLRRRDNYVVTGEHEPQAIRHDAGRRVGRELLARAARAQPRCMVGPSADILVAVAAIGWARNDRRRGG
jgi:hypothetical protein